MLQERTAQTGSLCYKNAQHKLEVYATRSAQERTAKLEVYATRTYAAR